MKEAGPRFLAIDALQALLVEWQARLGLQGYVIEIQLVRSFTFGDHGTLGDCDMSHTKRRALIRMLEAQDHNDPDCRYDDHETCLVHELLHIVMPMHLFAEKVNANDLRYLLYEQGIDQLARTLVALKRST